MASPVAAYPNSTACSSRKIPITPLSISLGIPTCLLTNLAIEAARDFIVLTAILTVLFMVPA